MVANMEVDMVADMEVDMVADMEVDKVADKMATKKVANMVADRKKQPTWGWTWCGGRHGVRPGGRH